MQESKKIILHGLGSFDEHDHSDRLKVYSVAYSDGDCAYIANPQPVHYGLRAETPTRLCDMGRLARLDSAKVSNWIAHQVPIARFGERPARVKFKLHWPLPTEQKSQAAFTATLPAGCRLDVTRVWNQLPGQQFQLIRSRSEYNAFVNRLGELSFPYEPEKLSAWLDRQLPRNRSELDVLLVGAVSKEEGVQFFTPDLLLAQQIERTEFNR